MIDSLKKLWLYRKEDIIFRKKFQTRTGNLLKRVHRSYEYVWQTSMGQQPKNTIKQYNQKGVNMASFNWLSLNDFSSKKFQNGFYRQYNKVLPSDII